MLYEPIMLYVWPIFDCLLNALTNILIVVSEKKTNIGTFKLGQVRFSKPRNKARLILSGR